MKTNLLLLHGALGSSRQFEKIIPHLENGFQVHRFNFEGHGGRPSESAFSMQLFVSNCLEYLEENQIESTEIFGYSMGGYVALKLALKAPDRISKITTLGTKFDWTPETAAREIKMLNPEVIEEKVPKFAEMLKRVHHPSDWKEVMHKTARMMELLGNNEALKEQEFEQIKVPVRLGLGTEDTMVSKLETTMVEDLLPNATFHQLHGVPHPLEKADSEFVGSFIKRSIPNS